MDAYNLKDHDKRGRPLLYHDIKHLICYQLFKFFLCLQVLKILCYVGSNGHSEFRSALRHKADIFRETESKDLWIYSEFTMCIIFLEDIYPAFMAQ